MRGLTLGGRRYGTIAREPKGRRSHEDWSEMSAWRLEMYELNKEPLHRGFLGVRGQKARSGVPANSTLGVQRARNDQRVLGHSPLLSRRHGHGGRSVEVVVPGNRAGGDGGRGNGGDVQAGRGSSLGTAGGGGRTLRLAKSANFDPSHPSCLQGQAGGLFSRPIEASRVVA